MLELNTTRRAGKSEKSERGRHAREFLKQTCVHLSITDSSHKTAYGTRRFLDSRASRPRSGQGERNANDGRFRNTVKITATAINAHKDFGGKKFPTGSRRVF